MLTAARSARRPSGGRAQPELLFGGLHQHGWADSKGSRKRPDGFERNAEAALLDLADEGSAEASRARELVLSHPPGRTELAQVPSEAVAKRNPRCALRCATTDDHWFTRLI